MHWPVVMDERWAYLYKALDSDLAELTESERQRHLDKIWDQSERMGVRWSYPGCSDYPVAWMRMIDNGGPQLFCYRGDPVWMTRPTISIVGSRTPMRDTCLWMQREISQLLDLTDIAVVSGGARGVDQWAHRICMDSGRPTVCIFPAGLAKIYPPGSENLFQRILDTGGAWVSTFPLNQEMRKRMFIARNRWIAGLSPVTFVAEANRRSGSSLTAALAHAEGRELCTLPVSPYSTQGLGNLDLIRNLKAHMIRDYRDLGSLYAEEVNLLKVGVDNVFD